MQDIEAGNEDVTALGEELIDRLRILNYEKDYVSKYLIRIFQRQETHQSGDVFDTD